MNDDQVLHTKYRPRGFDEVVGHNAAVKALTNVIGKGRAKSFVFVGPSGVGKTTLARIVADECGCDASNIQAIDAATHSGADAMRQVAEAIHWRPFGIGKKLGKGVIIDECHNLSKQAWDALLKVVEEPPKHAFWFFCTTDPRKVPATLKTRCMWLDLKPIPEEKIKSLLYEVCGLEKIKLERSLVDMIAAASNGSPRQALTSLAACADLDTRKEVAEMLRVTLESDATIELCRFLMQPGSWVKAAGIVAKLGPSTTPEGVRIVVCNYMGSVLKNARSDKDATNVLAILDAFCVPYNQAEGIAPLYLSIGRAMFGGK